MAKNKPLKGLLARQELFCRYVAGGMNASRAAINAGYSEKGNRSRACRLMKRPEIRTAIKLIQEDMGSLLMAGAKEAITHLISIGTANITDFFEIVDGQLRWKENVHINQAKSIKEITTITRTLKSGQTRTTIRVKLFDKIRAINILFKMGDIYPRNHPSQPHPSQPHPSQPITQPVIMIDFKDIDLSKLL